MAIITDPDNLDRFQVLVDYEGEKISIRAVDTANPRVEPKPTGTQVAGGEVLTDGAQLFVTSGVAVGDTLVIVEGPNINHWPITARTETTITVETGTLGAFNNNYTGQYAVYPATGGQVTDGATLQAIYSFLKEEWKTQASSGDAGALTDLIQFIFPLESITREQFEIGGPTHSDWDWKDDTTRNLIRTAGWNKLNAAGTIQQQYAGVVTLGSLDSDTQVYYQQIDSTSGTVSDPKNFVLLGAVNQAILFNDPAGTVNNEDNSRFLKLFARKKARTYPTSEIGDIGVTDLENIVNRFPLTHIADPAIVDSDGTLAGTTEDETATTQRYQSNVEVFTASDGSTSSQDGSQQEQTFTFTSLGSDFTASGIRPKDVLITGGLDAFEIVSVGTTTIDCLQEPGVAIPTSAGTSFSVRTRIRIPNLSDGIASASGGSSTLTGIFDSAGAQFVTSGVTTNDMLAILDGNDTVEGIYKIIDVINETGLGINTIDQAWDGGPYTSLSYEIYRRGMQLQYKNEITDVTFGSAGDPVVFNNAASTIQVVGNNFTNSGYLIGGTIAISNAEDSANNQQVRITNVSTDTITVDGTITENTDDESAQFSGINGFIRTPAGGTISTYNWRLYGNNGTLAQCFQWIQKALRRGAATVLNDSSNRPIADIDNASGVFRGDVTDLLMSFASPNGTSLNMFIDDLNDNESNNITFEDILGVGRTNAFIVAVTLALNANITDDTSNKVTAFFVNDDAGDNLGRDFDTPDAIIIQDINGDPVSQVGSASDISFQYDFDNNVQRGAASAGEDVPIVAVAIGTSGAQWVLSSGTFTNENTFSLSLVAALERNYSNPS